MNFKQLLLSFFYLFCFSHSFGQKEYNNWYFGKNAAINFDSGNPVVKYDNTMSVYSTASSISDRNTGKLLFYTDGTSVWNKQHKIMAGNNIGASTDIIIVPYPNNENKYFIIGSPPTSTRALLYTTIDMSLNNGFGGLTKIEYMENSTGGYLLVAKHALENSYWLITHTGEGKNNLFSSNKITDNGIDTLPIESQYPNYPPVQRLGESTLSSDGTTIASTYYDPDTAAVQLYTFDKLCGTVSSPSILHVEPNWILAQGICFSPDNTKLYATFSSTANNNPSTSYLIQYYGANFSQWQVIASSLQTFNGLRLGPDNRIYISINDSIRANPSSRVDALLYPDKLGIDVGYTQKYLDLGDDRTTNYKFPTMIYDKSPLGIIKNIDLLTEKVCLGDSTKFSTPTTIQYDSILWDFGDGTTFSSLSSPIHKYNDTGIYKVQATFYLCKQNWTISKNVTIYKAPQVGWSTDTSFCYNSQLILKTPFNTGKFTWSTQENTPTIKINKRGLYWVKVVLGSCTASDSIYITELPPILVDIGDNYTICSEDNELVKLDAGKGYEHYKWTPTGDTAQWIIVKSEGDYYVVVADYRGCKGDDGTKILRLCDFTFYMPTAFTPNSDGKNDEFAPVYSDVTDFRMEIFDRWGEKVFETNNITQGWNGMYENDTAPVGIYAWQLSFKGYHNKLLRNYNYKGLVNLLR